MEEKKPLDNSAAAHHNQHGDGEDQKHNGNNLEAPAPLREEDHGNTDGDKGEDPTQ